MGDIHSEIVNQVVASLDRHAASMQAMNGLLRSVKIDVKITPGGLVRAVIVQMEIESGRFNT